MSIRKVIHQIWIGSKMPDGVRFLVGGVAEKNATWQHLLWTDGLMAGLGVSVDRLRGEFGTWASASNFVRLLILQRHGGIYLDTDFECLKPIDPLLGLGDCIAAEQDGGRICNAFMGCTPNHPWVNWQLAHLGNYDRKDAASGVYVATDAPRDGLTIVPQHWVYPWMYDSPPSARVPHPESLLAHLWHGSWNK